MRRFTMTHRDELGNAIPMFDDAGQCEMNSGLQKAMNRLADYEDKAELACKRNVTDGELELINVYVEKFIATSCTGAQLSAACELVGALQMLFVRWESEN